MLLLSLPKVSTWDLYVTGFGKTLHKAALTFWYHIKGLVPENTVIPKPKPCSVPFQSYGCFKNDFCIHVNGDVNFDKHVHENMFTSLVEGFPKTGHNYGITRYWQKGH